jgi:hypothetical protein
MFIAFADKAPLLGLAAQPLMAGSISAPSSSPDRLGVLPPAPVSAVLVGRHRPGGGPALAAGRGHPVVAGQFDAGRDDAQVDRQPHLSGVARGRRSGGHAYGLQIVPGSLNAMPTAISVRG